MANEQEKQEQRQGLPKMVGLKDEEWSVGFCKEACAPLSVGHKSQEGLRVRRGTAPTSPVTQRRLIGLQLNECRGCQGTARYANCLTVEMTPFDLSILFGKVRPTRDANGQNQLVEMYDRQVYLSHLQARALYEGLGRSLSASSRQARQPQPEAVKPEGPPQGS